MIQGLDYPVKFPGHVTGAALMNEATLFSLGILKMKRAWGNMDLLNTKKTAKTTNPSISLYFFDKFL